MNSLFHGCGSHFLIILCLEGSYCHSLGASYSFSGDVAITIPVNETGERQELQRFFDISIRGCEWLIETRNITTTRTQAWAVASVNGREVLYSTYTSAGTTVSLIESNSTPADCPDGVSHFLWAMFASGCYLNKSNQGMFPALFDPSASVLFDKDYRLPAFWERFDSRPFAVRQIVILNDGFWRSRNESNTFTVKTPLGVPFQKGFTNAVILCEQWTNANGFTLPLECSFTEYSPMITTNGRQGLLTKRVVRAFVSTVRVQDIEGHFFQR